MPPSSAAAPSPLIGGREPGPVRHLPPPTQAGTRAQGSGPAQMPAASPFVFVCDHAGNAVPAALRQLGVAERDLQRHIAWDIGTAGLAAHLARDLGAAAILQRYSRLVIDCNRPPGHAQSVLAVSDGTEIPGNAQLTPADIAAREAAIFHPYQAAIAALLDQRQAAGQASILVSLHSFTPVFQGQARSCQIGLLFDRDPHLARALGRLLRAQGGFDVQDNAPYALDQATDYTIPVHGEQRGIASLELELRQDLIADNAGQARMAALLAGLLPRAAAMIAS